MIMDMKFYSNVWNKEMVRRMGRLAFLIFSFSHFLISTAGAQAVSTPMKAGLFSAQDGRPFQFAR